MWKNRDLNAAAGLASGFALAAVIVCLALYKPSTCCYAAGAGVFVIAASVAGLAYSGDFKPLKFCVSGGTAAVVLLLAALPFLNPHR
jgi:hypothetical protein